MARQVQVQYSQKILEREGGRPGRSRNRRHLTGALPFTASDPIEWVRCHIARKPVPPSELSVGSTSEAGSTLDDLRKKREPCPFLRSAGDLRTPLRGRIPSVGGRLAAGELG